MTDAVGSDFKLMRFRHREQAIEVLRLDGEKLQFQRTELAGSQYPIAVAHGDQAVTHAKLAGGHPRLQPVTNAFGHTCHEPFLMTRCPLAGRTQRQFTQYKMALKSHRRID